MRQDEFGEYRPTPQQRKMIDVAGYHWSKDRQPDLHTLMMVWSYEVSPYIPIHSILAVYDYLIETGYYNPLCL